MALISFILPTQPAGSTGGLTLYKNGAQLAMRARAYPVKVRSNPHTAVMSIIGALSMDWELALTGSDRAAWGTYAFNTPLTDAYGNPRYVRGYAHYMRSNRPRSQQGAPRVDAGPTVFGIPSYVLPTISLSSDNQLISVLFDAGDDWVNEDNAYMFCWASRPTRASRLRPPEVYRPIGLIAGSSTTPPVPPAVFAAPAWTPTLPTTLFVRTSISRADGRLSGL